MEKIEKTPDKINTDKTRPQSPQQNDTPKITTPSANTLPERIDPALLQRVSEQIRQKIGDNVDAKNINVDSVIEELIKNEYILQVFKNSSPDNKFNIEFRDKLTRSKYKELIGSNTVKSLVFHSKHENIKSELHVLINQELPEDDEDDEYVPSDDDHETDEDHDSTFISDGLSTASSPCKSMSPSPNKFKSPKMVNTENSTQTDDSCFKVPTSAPKSLRAKNINKSLFQSSAGKKIAAQNNVENIALRTRSKLSLSDTPLETIEQAFVPPDVTKDMYESVCDDEHWSNFLKEFTEPLENVIDDKMEDDDVADPEYSFSTDQEPDAPEEEHMAIEVSKRELRQLWQSIQPDDLIATPCLFDELTLSNATSPENSLKEDENHVSSFNRILDELMESSFSVKKNDETNKENNGKDKNGNDKSNEKENEKVIQMKTVKSENCQKSANTKKTDQNDQSTANQNTQINPINDSLPNSIYLETPEITVTVEPELIEPTNTIISNPLQNVKIFIPIGAAVITQDQLSVLNQQMQQHVQLLTQHYLQTFAHSEYHQVSENFNSQLDELNSIITKHPCPLLKVENLPSALNLIDKWRRKVNNYVDPEAADYREYQKTHAKNINTYHGSAYHFKFHNLFLRFVAESEVFLYPRLLPSRPFSRKSAQTMFTSAEDQLIAFGIVSFAQKWRQNVNETVQDIIQRCGFQMFEICKFLREKYIPYSSGKRMVKYVNTMKSSHKDNVIKNCLFKVPPLAPIKHLIENVHTANGCLRSPKMCEPSELKNPWLEFIYPAGQKKITDWRVPKIPRKSSKKVFNPSNSIEANSNAPRIVTDKHILINMGNSTSEYRIVLLPVDRETESTAELEQDNVPHIYLEDGSSLSQTSSKKVHRTPIKPVFNNINDILKTPVGQTIMSPENCHKSPRRMSSFRKSPPKTPVVISSPLTSPTAMEEESTYNLRKENGLDFICSDADSDENSLMIDEIEIDDTSWKKELDDDKSSVTKIDFFDENLNAKTGRKRVSKTTENTTKATDTPVNKKPAKRKRNGVKDGKINKRRKSEKSPKKNPKKVGQTKKNNSKTFSPSSKTFSPSPEVLAVNSLKIKREPVENGQYSPGYTDSEYDFRLNTPSVYSISDSQTQVKRLDHDETESVSESSIYSMPISTSTVSSFYHSNLSERTAIKSEVIETESDLDEEWTKDEDKIILAACLDEVEDMAGNFARIHDEYLPRRSVRDINGRFHTLIAILAQAPSHVTSSN